MCGVDGGGGLDKEGNKTRAQVCLLDQWARSDGRRTPGLIDGKFARNNVAGSFQSLQFPVDVA